MNPLFVKVMDESAPEKHALCRLARILKKGGTLNFTQTSQEQASVNESCLATKIMKTLWELNKVQRAVGMLGSG